MFDYKLLSKCSEKLWNSFLNKDRSGNKEELMDNIFDNEISLSEDEIDYTKEQKEKLD